jgi:cell surface protein SprA
VNISKTENPRIPIHQRKITTFNFDQRIQLNLVGNIGDKLKINTNYNTEATFDFENQVKLDYTGHEDEIIQKIEAGNVSLPLQRPADPRQPKLVRPEDRVALRQAHRHGHLQPGERATQERASGKAVRTDHQLSISSADEYEANKYYFLSHYFRDRYESCAAHLCPP